MSQLTIEKLQELEVTLNKAYAISQGKTLQSVDNWLPRFSTQSSTPNRSEKFPFLYNNLDVDIREEGEAPILRDLVGTYVDITLRKITGGAFLRQLDFHSPFFQSQLMEEVKALGQLSVLKPLDMAIESLNEGDTNPRYTMYDGKQLFATDHVINGITYSNLKAGALTKANFIAHKSAMRRIPWGPNGRFMRLTGASWYLFIPPELQYEARELMRNSRSAEDNKNTENVLKDEAEIIVDEGLTDANDWFLVMTLPNGKPWVHMKHKSLSNRKLISNMAENDPNVVNRDEYTWTLKSFEEVFPTQFWLMTKVVAP